MTHDIRNIVVKPSPSIHFLEPSISLLMEGSKQVGTFSPPYVRWNGFSHSGPEYEPGGRAGKDEKIFDLANFPPPPCV